MLLNNLNLNDRGEEKVMNYYELLEVQVTASDEVIRMAYKALVKKYHPDVYEGDIEYAKEMLQKVNKAYEILSNPETRKKYDREFVFGRKDKIDFGLEKEYEHSEIVYGKKANENSNLIYVILDFVSSVLKFCIGCIVLYIVIGSFTGNLKEWNGNIIYYSKVIVHWVNNLNARNEYEDNSAEKAIDLYLRAIYDGNEYEALQQIKTGNNKLYELTENMVLIFKTMENDEMMSYMFNDMKKAEYSIEQGHVENQYIVTFLTCDYEIIVNQISTNTSDSVIAKKINQRIKIAPKTFKKEVEITMEYIEGKWCVSSIQDQIVFIDALTGNLLGNIYDEVIQKIR